MHHVRGHAEQLPIRFVSSTQTMLHFDLMIRLYSSFVFIVSLASASPITVDYTLNMGPGGSNKTDVTSIAVFQSNGSQLDLSFIPSIAGFGTTLISVASPFTPTFSLLIGISEPAGPSGRRHLIGFVSQSFANDFTGIKFSEAFLGYGERAFSAPLLAASSGDTTQQEWLRTFYTSQGYKAAFTTGSVPLAGEFTTFTPLVVPEPATFSLAGFTLLALFAARRKW